MRLSKYQALQVNKDKNQFWFKSAGLKGTITKVVIFEELPEKKDLILVGGEFEPLKK